MPLDAAWRLANPLPTLLSGGSKEERGRILIVGGSRFVPGALGLTFEAALRVGAGKAQIATVASVALPLGVTLPEAAVVALPEDDEGQIAAGAAGKLTDYVQKCDCLIFGCGTAPRPQTGDIIEELLANLPQTSLALLDAGGIVALKGRGRLIRESGKRVLLTPHHGELAALTGGSKDAVAHRPAEAAARAADELSAIVVLKDRTTFIAEPGGSTVEYMNEAQGLGTAGSGDVLAGIIGGVLGRADDAKTAAAWGVWLHAMAGQSAARRIGPIGYMARDLAIELPSILNQMPQRT